MDKPELTVIITAHAEGLLIHKTLLSVFRALVHIEAAKIPYEILVHIDNGDEATAGYLDRYSGDPRFRLVNSDFGDLGLSRNRAISEAQGEYVAILDGDDLVSENWLIAAWQLVKGHERDNTDEQMIIARPEAILSFFPPEGGDWPVCVQYNTDSGSREYEAIRMISSNPWPPTLLARREVLLTTDYQQNKRGFGYEDFTFNADTLAKGIRHLVVPETVLFYRRKTDGVLAQLSSNKAVYHYSELFGTAFMQTIPTDSESADAAENGMSQARRLVKSVYQSVEKIPVIGLAARGSYDIWWRLNQGFRRGQQAAPEWLVNEWRGINEIEFGIFPRSESVQDLEVFSTTNDSVGWTYRRLIDGVQPAVDYLFIIPGLADDQIARFILSYIKTLLQQTPGLRIAVLATEPDNDGRSDLPDEVGFIDFGGLANENLDYEKEILADRLIVQLKVKSVHLIDSVFGYDWVSLHRQFLMDNGIDVFATLFGQSIGADGRRVSFSDPYLMAIYPLVRSIFADSPQTVDEAVQACGYDPSRFTLCDVATGRQAPDCD